MSGFLTAYLNYVTLALVLVTVALQVLIGRRWRRTVRLKDQTIASKDEVINNRLGELLWVRQHCVRVLRVQHNALDVAMARLAILDRTFMPSKSGPIWDGLVAGNDAIKWLESAEKLPSFACPDCHLVSYNANDIENRYCGACHKFFPPAGPGDGIYYPAPEVKL